MRQVCLAMVVLVWFLFGSFTDSAHGQIKAQFKSDISASIPQARFYDRGGVVNAIYGTTLSTGETPLASAQAFLNQWDGMFADEIGVLIPRPNPAGEILQGVMYNQATGQHKFYTMRFDQYYQELPVFRSGAGFLVRNEPNNPLVMTGFQIRDMAGFDAAGAAGAEPVVTQKMIDNVNAMMNTQGVPQPRNPRPLKTSEERLVIWAGVDNAAQDPIVALEFVAERGSVQTYPDHQKFLILASASSGEIIFAETKIHNVDITGTVSGRATTGIKAAECDPENSVRLPYAQAQVIGGNSVFSNSNGAFTIPHAGTTAVTVRSQLRGQWFEVRDQSAANAIPFIDMTVTPPGPANFLHNPNANQEFPTANVNAYLEANICRDYVLSFEPTFPVINTQTFFDINTNINSTCNAYYDGVSINFYRAGGGCFNTAFSDVVHHEYGHHLVDVTDNGQGQFGEGAGDCMGVLIQDDPILAHGFSGNCNAGIRNANNNIQYPAGGEIHSAGQLISGCVWDTRDELLITEPANYRNIGGALFVGMLIVRGQVDPFNDIIDPLITIIYLEVDDDDADIGNGTPHYQEIATGFGKHNMDAPALDLIDFSYPNGRPQLVSPNGGNAFTVQVVELNEAPQPGTGVLHVDRGNGWETFAMNQTSPNVYQANFPSSPCGTTIKYFITAETASGAEQSDPKEAPTSVFTAISGSDLTSVFTDNFQTNKGWTVSNTATDGQWQRAVPAGGGDRGDPPTDADGSGFCYVTDNADGNSDVDAGNTILTSPTINASAAAGKSLFVTYYRWYSNSTGDAPFADTFVVQVSNNNGSTWTNVEIVGPSGAEVSGGWFQKTFNVSNIIAPSAQMRFRFTASDLGTGSIVEAGVDGFDLYAIGCDASTTVAPNQLTVIKGSNVGGTLADVAESDDVRLCYRSVFNRPPPRTLVSLEFSGESPTDTPTSLSVVVESRVNGTGVTQTIEAFNFDTSAYEVVDTRAATLNSDAVVTVALSGDASRFVQAGTGAMKTRVSLVAPMQREQFDACLDQVVWVVD